MNEEPHHQTETRQSSVTSKLKQVPIAWEALEDAFENNAPEVHSYLQLSTGEVIRIVDGVADPQMHSRIISDANYLRVDPVSSREQYRWMERFIETAEDPNFQDRLLSAIDGKGAFRRFKDVLMHYPAERERWFSFRSERLRACMEAWLEAHGIEAVSRPEWKVPEADEMTEAEYPAGASSTPGTSSELDSLQQKGREMLEALPAQELDLAVAFLEFLMTRRFTWKTKTRAKHESGLHERGTGAALTEDSENVRRGQVG